MKTTISRRSRRLSILLFVGACTLGWVTDALAQGPLRYAYGGLRAAPGTYSNWIDLGLTSPMVDGNVGEFVQRQRIAGSTFVGIEDLHIEQFVGEDAMVTLGGRAIVANRDYDLHVGIEDPDIGYARTGFRRFCVFYDGSGGYFAPTGAYFDPTSYELGMDRGETFIEGGLRMESLPHLTVKYTRKIRDGRKPSLSWGDSNVGQAGMKNIVPSFWKSDEVRNIFEGRLEQKLGANNLGVAVRYESSDINNARNLHRRPEETSERFLTQNDGALADLFNVSTSSETRLRKNMLLTTSYSFTTLNNDLSGDRIYGVGFASAYDPAYAGRQQRDEGFLDLVGTSQVKRHLGSVGLIARPWSQLAILPALRIEKTDVNGSSDVIETAVQRDLSITKEELALASRRGQLDLVGKLEARYTGVRKLLLYVRGDWVRGHGDLVETETERETGHLAFERSTNDTRRTQKYLAGANWYPLRWMNFGMQVYRKHRDIGYENGILPAGTDDYPGFLTDQAFTTDVVNVRVRWRPMRGVAVANRYDYQHYTIRGDAAELNAIQSAQTDRHVISNTVTWTPLAQIYLQGTLNYVQNETHTPSNDLTGAAENLVLPSRNDYVNASFASGFALTSRIDGEVQYFYFRADNYVDNSSVSLPFDSGVKEHGLSAGIAMQVSEQFRWTTRYAYFLNREETFGGNGNYDMQLLYTSVEFQF